MEVSTVRNRLRRTLEAARERAQHRRQRGADAEKEFAVFLEQVAVPVVRQLANALKAEGYAFTVFTPGGGLRLASDRARDDYIEFALDMNAPTPHVVGRISYSRGSRTLEDERPIKDGVPPGALTDEDVLEFLLQALEPWLER
jgi:hypothetical protein